MWLAHVGYERVKEIEDPELATKRTRAIYKAKGYPDSWIEKKMRGIAVRDGLTNEWQKRGVLVKKEYEILTVEISKATFDMTPSEYKKFKNLVRENLRDHMDDLELILTMLGEATTIKLHRDRQFNRLSASAPRHQRRRRGCRFGAARYRKKNQKTSLHTEKLFSQKNPGPIAQLVERYIRPPAIA